MLASRLRLTAALIVAGAALTGCSSGTSPATARLAPAATNTVRISSVGFSPQTIMVPIGTVVTWTVGDADQHTVQAQDKSFDSGALGAGQSYSFTFSQPGTYRYGCALHPGMTGTVTVS